MMWSRLFFLLLKNKQTKKTTFTWQSIKLMNWSAEPVRDSREPSECSRVAPPSGARARCSQLITCASSASSGWRSSGSRSCWRGLSAWRSSRIQPCSWCRGSRTRRTGCSRCGGGRAGTAPGKRKEGSAFFFDTLDSSTRRWRPQTLTSCRDVRYFFHHRYFCMWGPMAARP